MQPVPDGARVALCFNSDELDTITAILFVSLGFGWRSKDDHLFPPRPWPAGGEDRHHDVVHVECGDEERMLESIEDTKDSGHGLPTQPPEWTFYRPEWMGPEPARWRQR